LHGGSKAFARIGADEPFRLDHVRVLCAHAQSEIDDSEKEATTLHGIKVQRSKPVAEMFTVSPCATTRGAFMKPTTALPMGVVKFARLLLPP